MKLTNQKTKDVIDFGPIFCAPWVRGFFGRMHWPLYFLYPLGLTWKHTGFAAKTIMLHRHFGNVDLDENGNILAPLTRAVYFSFWRNCFVNAFGLSNPGLKKCLELRYWRKMEHPFIISFTSIAQSRNNRLDEVIEASRLLKESIERFNAPVALQYNAGCPNEGVYRDMNAKELTEEILGIVTILKNIGIPIILNINALMPLEVIRAVHESVDAFWIGNTIPVGNPAIDWTKIFEKGVSPLIRRGMKLPGGYSGPEAFTLTAQKVFEIRQADIQTPIIAGNGIRYPWHVSDLKKAGANAIFVGSIILRPWRMRSIIREAYLCFAQPQTEKRK